MLSSFRSWKKLLPSIALPCHDRKSPSRLALEILEDRRLPTVVSILPVQTGVEGSFPDLFRLVRDTTVGSLTVNYALDTANTTATSGSDFFDLTGSVRFADGQSTVDIIVEMYDDSDIEADEIIAINLLTDGERGCGLGNYTLGTISSAFLTITDNDTLVEPQITFLDYELSPNNSDANLFAADSGSQPLTLINLTVVVAGVAPNGVMPTGSVVFTGITPDGRRSSLGIASVGHDGKATIQDIDSGMLGQPGLVIEADYSGDPFFAAKKEKDNGRTANDVQADPPVTDNPVIAPNARNLTVVIVAGRDGAQRRQWRDSARRHYGANAYIITDVHSVADLGARLADLPAGSVSRLVIGGHGNTNGVQLGNPGVAATRFNARNVDLDPQARQRIQNALANNALIDLQACSCAADEAGQNNLQRLANIFNARVRGADRQIGNWDDNAATWIIRNPE
jgi:hypothetical protein